MLAPGFIEFVSSHAMGEPLFHNPRAAEVVRKTFPSESTGKALATWVRSLGVTERDVDPNHGWRHRFKTDGRFAEVGEDVISALQGHAIAFASFLGVLGEFLQPLRLGQLPSDRRGLAGGATAAAPAPSMTPPTTRAPPQTLVQKFGLDAAFASSGPGCCALATVLAVSGLLPLWSNRSPLRIAGEPLMRTLVEWVCLSF